jgi:hypothetical protein
MLLVQLYNIIDDNELINMEQFVEQIGRGNWSAQIKSIPAPLYPPQIPHQIWTIMVERWQLTLSTAAKVINDHVFKEHM